MPYLVSKVVPSYHLIIGVIEGSLLMEILKVPFVAPLQLSLCVAAGAKVLMASGVKAVKVVVAVALQPKASVTIRV